MPESEHPKQRHSGRGSRAGLLCAMAVLLFPFGYLGSYWLLLDRETSHDTYLDADIFIIVPPEPKPCIREQYLIDGDRVKLFFRPANRLHRVIDRWIS